MGLAGIELIVKDMAAAIAFYARLGVEFPDGAAAQPHMAVELPNGIELSFDTLDFTRWGFDPGWTHGPGTINTLQWSMPTREAVDDVYADLTGAGYHGHLAPHDAFWGARYAIVMDPDGNAVGFQSPPDPSKRVGPPTKFS
ncbi:MAG TPA: VOC family protein [Acidimicrobiales bacterium]|nr:VOC family protein [Acidimicrobiales bacterium]